MNIERLNNLIDYLKQPHETVGFDMREYYGERRIDEEDANACGTVACLAGHCVLMVGGDGAIKGMKSADIFDFAQDYLGLTSNEAFQLFCCNGDTPGMSATLPEAIETLELLRDHGEVVWEHVTDRIDREQGWTYGC